MVRLNPRVRLPPLPSVRDLVKLYRLKAQRQLSQNFLLDENLTDKIVKTAGRIKGHYIVEVGPGPGSITRSILKREPKKLIVVEKDERFVPTLELLQEACRDTTEMVVEIGDIKFFNLEKGFEGAPVREWEDYLPPVHLIGNLPFNVSTNLIIRWLTSISERKSAWIYGRAPLTLTFQKEVGERMIASPGDKQRCRLSVMSQLWTSVNYEFTIPGRAFSPKPEVDVAVMKFVPLKKPLINLPFGMVEKVVRTVFNMRQKYCRRSAERLFPEENRMELCLKLLSAADVDPEARPFRLTNEDYVRICYAYNVLCEEIPDLEFYDSRSPAVLRDYV